MEGFISKNEWGVFYYYYYYYYHHHHHHHLQYWWIEMWVNEKTCLEIFSLVAYCGSRGVKEKVKWRMVSSNWKPQTCDKKCHVTSFPFQRRKYTPIIQPHLLKIKPTPLESVYPLRYRMNFLRVGADLWGWLFHVAELMIRSC